MSGTNGKKWSAAEYRQRKAERRDKKEPQWQTNPATGSEFFLRRTGIVGYLVAGAMPHSMTNEALKAWSEQGLASAEQTLLQKIDPRLKREADRNIGLMAKVINDACVIPKLVPGATGENDGEIDPADLDDEDILFIFRWATGRIGSVSLKGGEVIPVEDLQTFPEQPGSSPGVGLGSEELLTATQ